ncbi:MAG: RNA polymerase sigma factor [Firmicutes bacterium]|nr:RNA polymerase sigma factor [Bacillota bacterium]
MADDADLVARACGGDLAAFEELFARYHGAAWRLAFALTGDRRGSDDIVQEAFLHAFRALPGFRPHPPFAPGSLPL